MTKYYSAATKYDINQIKLLLELGMVCDLILQTTISSNTYLYLTA